MPDEYKLAVPPELFEALVEEVVERVTERLMPPTLEPWIGIEEAAAHLACRPRRPYALKSQGRIPHRKDGARLLFRRSELDASLEQGGPREHDALPKHCPGRQEAVSEVGTRGDPGSKSE